uniref:Uncharacterized protein n=1 Tax=Eutreptiella gymnastica TaxID=73025 RepID=A0A7S4FE66_9EUGL
MRQGTGENGEAASAHTRSQQQVQGSNTAPLTSRTQLEPAACRAELRRAQPRLMVPGVADAGGETDATRRSLQSWWLDPEQNTVGQMVCMMASCPIRRLRRRVLLLSCAADAGLPGCRWCRGVDSPRHLYQVEEDIEGLGIWKEFL